MGPSRLAGRFRMLPAEGQAFIFGLVVQTGAFGETGMIEEGGGATPAG